MGSIIRSCATLAFTLLSLAPAIAEGQGPWRAIAAAAYERTFATTLSGKKPTEDEAIVNARSVCQEDVKQCMVVTSFNAGCRYVMLGGRVIDAKTLEPVFLIGTSPEDARSRCKALGLVCEREPQGGCMD